MKKAKEIKPDYFTPYFNIAAYYSSKADYDKAIAEYLAILKIDQKNLQALLTAAALYELKGDESVALEYFIEGTRSRTGRLLQPRLGMLAMTVRGFLRARNRPVVFQPLSIGFERMAEGHVYTAELSGAPKKSESLRDFFNALKMLRRTYGKVHVSFGEPIFP